MDKLLDLELPQLVYTFDLQYYFISSFIFGINLIKLIINIFINTFIIVIWGGVWLSIPILMVFIFISLISQFLNYIENRNKRYYLFIF